MIIVHSLEDYNPGMKIYIRTDHECNLLDPPQPAIVIRKATFEEYAKYHEGANFPLSRAAGPKSKFYEVSTD